MDNQLKKDLWRGLITLLIALITILFLLCSCETTGELYQRKLNRAKKKIDRLTLKFPELKTVSDTTYIISDTTIVNNTHYINDSIFIQGGQRIDTIVQVTNMDSLITILNDNIELRLEEIGGGHVRAAVSVVPHYIYETDTLHTVDTIYREKIVKETTNVVNTEKSFWWSLWFQVKGWLWVILIVAAILLILRVIFKFIG